MRVRYVPDPSYLLGSAHATFEQKHTWHRWHVHRLDAVAVEWDTILTDRRDDLDDLGEVFSASLYTAASDIGRWEADLHRWITSADLLEQRTGEYLTAAERLENEHDWWRAADETEYALQCRSFWSAAVSLTVALADRRDSPHRGDTERHAQHIEWAEAMIGECRKRTEWHRTRLGTAATM